mgnify:CR=1 FL=1
MKSIRLKTLIMAFCLLLMSANVWSGAHDREVVIEISADNMNAEKVEENIADPIEILMGNLKDVLLISAKYSDNKAEITVKFDPETTQQESLVGRVREALDKMTSMPDSIISLSVTLADDLPDDVVSKIRPAQERSFDGKYLGSIQSSNESVPVLTHFFKSEDRWNTLSSGKYHMSEAKSVVIGHLSSCLAKEGYLVKCRWKDKYGQGDVSFQFADDYERFKASWTIDRFKGEFKWNGAKVQIAVE